MYDYKMCLNDMAGLLKDFPHLKISEIGFCITLLPISDLDRVAEENIPLILCLICEICDKNDP
ncbi:MAG: hypothetical protein IK057_06320 [Clostridia bacterium]|nr:hypothetical protein [Clostridia bacterium]